MWFRRRNTGYAKSLKMWTHEGPNIKKIWTHEGPTTKKMMSTWRLMYKEKDSHVSKPYVIERDHIYKRSIVFVHLFPHTCTSWSKSMSLLSSIPQFNFTTQCNTSMLYCSSLPKAPHKTFLEVGENKRRQNFAIYW